LDLNSVLEVYSTLSMPQYHVVGNHCLAAGKEELQKRLKLSSFYYDFTVPEAQGWRFVVLDGNDAGNGRLGATQLEWLRSKLAKARAGGEKVIVFSHFPRPRSAARQLINESDCVVAYFAGHHHGGRYALQDGIHHITVKGMVEAPIRNAYAILEVSPTKLREIGFGKEPSREMELSARPSDGSGRGDAE
jgi:manganese-dependent ADP-ribose/CDP-alcohol diphosphatase